MAAVADRTRRWRRHHRAHRSLYDGLLAGFLIGAGIITLALAVMALRTT